MGSNAQGGELPVIDSMPFAQAATLEFCHGSIQWLITVMFAPLGALESLGRRQDLVDMLRIVRPVSRNMERAMPSESIGTEPQKFRLHDAPFVVALFRPRVRKIQIDAL